MIVSCYATQTVASGSAKSRTQQSLSLSAGEQWSVECILASFFVICLQASGWNLYIMTPCGTIMA
jgi:hypothetical protein